MIMKQIVAKLIWNTSKDETLKVAMKHPVVVVVVVEFTLLTSILSGITWTG